MVKFTDFSRKNEALPYKMTKIHSVSYNLMETDKIRE